MDYDVSKLASMALTRQMSSTNALRSALQGTQKQTAGTQPAGGQDDQAAKKIDQAGTDLEALFINHLFKQMRATIPKSELLGNSVATDMFRSMLDSKMAEVLAQRGTLGLGQMVSRQLSSTGEPPGGNSEPRYNNIKETNRSNR